MKTERRIALFIGRFQPFHLGHLYVIEEANKSEDIDEIIIGIGSSQFENTARNPFSFREREKMIRESIDIDKPYNILRIPDINNYKKWVEHVEALVPKFHVVYTNSEITKKLFKEKRYEVRGTRNNFNFSGTEIRELMLSNSSWKEYVPKGTARLVQKINGEERLKKICIRYINPAVTADIIIENDREEIGLIKRKNDPYRGRWAFPGGFIETNNETIEATAVREMKEETGLDVKLEDLELVGIYSNPERDPRGHTIAIVYSVKVKEAKPKAGDDAAEFKFFKDIPKNLAFDHNRILQDYRKRKNEK